MSFLSTPTAPPALASLHETPLRKNLPDEPLFPAGTCYQGLEEMTSIGSSGFISEFSQRDDIGCCWTSKPQKAYLHP